MNEQAEHFLSTLDRSPRTIETYRWALSYYFFLVGEDLSNDRYEMFLIAIKGKSASTRSVLRSAVMGLYDFCDIGNQSKRERLNKHYARKTGTNPIVFNREAIEKIISYCDTLRKDVTDWRDRAFVLTLADSGFRISELCSLRRDDIDWLNRRVVVVGKRDKIAIVRLSKRSSEALMDYLQARDVEGWNKTGRPEPLFTQHDNLRQMTIDGMRKAIKQRMKEVGVKVRIHDFRHYFVTVTLLATGNLKTAKELARHESTKTTDRYAHLTDSELDKAYDEVFNR